MSIDDLLSLWAWVSQNKLASFVLALLAGAAGLYATGFFQEIGAEHARKWSKKKRITNRFDDIGDSFLPPNISSDIQPISSNDLIEYYRNEAPIKSRIGHQDWVFAASMAISPIGMGKLEEQHIYFETREEIFKLDPALDNATTAKLQEIESHAVENRQYNGQPWCIRGVQFENSKKVISATRCNYFDSLRTNFSMDMSLQGKSMTLRNLLHGKSRKFESFAGSRLPNHIGVAAIVESADGKLVVQHRSKLVAVRPNTLSASVSGTIEEDDLGKGNSGLSLVGAVGGLVREMFNELGTGRFTNIDSIAFLGLVREFRRGGLPDFYFYLRSDQDFETIKEHSRFAEERYEVDALIPIDFQSLAFLADPSHELECFERNTEMILESLEYKANLTLSLGIALTFEHMLRVAETERA